MEEKYLEKYKKYKAKYLNLRQSGGAVADYTKNICETEGKIQIRDLNGKSINFIYNFGGFTDCRMRFQVIYNTEFNYYGFISYENINTRERSMLTNNNEEHFNNKGDNLLNIRFFMNESGEIIKSKLNFIKANTLYASQELMSIYLCLSKYFEVPLLELEDDALFKTRATDGSEILYRALIYRALTNVEPSIYTKYGFNPKDSLPTEPVVSMASAAASAAASSSSSSSSSSRMEIHDPDLIIIKGAKIDDYIAVLRELMTKTSSQYMKKNITDVLNDLLKHISIKREITIKEYVERITKEITKEEKEIIKKFIDILNVGNQICSKSTENPLTCAFYRLYKKHQTMINSDYRCVLCR